MEENLKGKTKKELYWSFFNQFSNYGMNFIVGIVMARLLSPIGLWNNSIAIGIYGCSRYYSGWRIGECIDS